MPSIASMRTRRFITIITALILTACSNAPRQILSPPENVPATPPAVSTVNSANTQPTAAEAEPEDDNVQPTEPVNPEPLYSDAWDHIRKNLQLDRHQEQRSVEYKLAWFARNQDYLDRVAERATPYLYYVIQELEKRNMPLDLALLPIVESAYHPFAYSPSHASGIWQFIPSTGKHFGLKQNWWYDGRRDIIAATTAAMDYLQKLYEDFNGDWLLALAAYNSGELNVTRAIKYNKKRNKPTDFWHLRLPRETKGYVPSLLAIAEIVADPAEYGVTLQPIPNETQFAIVDTDGQLDLATAAKLADLSMDEIYTLNPGLNRWATDPDGPYRLLVPVDKAEQFREKLAALPDEERVNWKRHVIRQNETLSQIALLHHTDISTIRTANQLRGNLIRVGQSLLIPSSKLPLKNYTLSLDSRRYAGLTRAGKSGQQYVYTIRRGDTLWDIGRHYGVSIRMLCQWNGLSPRTILRPGQKLNLLLAGNENRDGSTTEVSLKTDDAGTINYTVKQGDSLWLISRRFGVTVAQLMKWNNLSESDLQPGQELILLNAQAATTGA